jgi:hypothetical protein
MDDALIELLERMDVYGASAGDIRKRYEAAVKVADRAEELGLIRGHLWERHGADFLYARWAQGRGVPSIDTLHAAIGERREAEGGGRG